MILPLVLLYLILAPGANYAVLLPCLTLAGVAGSLNLIRSGTFYRWSLAYFGLVLWGIYVLAVGFLTGNATAGLVDTAVPLVAGPLFWLVVTYAARPKFIRLLVPVISVGVMCVSAVVIATVFGARIPVLSGLNANLAGNRFSGGGVTKVRLTSASSLLAGVPFLVALAAFGLQQLPALHRRLVLIALPVGFVGLLLAGRQAGLLATAISFLLLPFVPRFLSGTRESRVRIPPIRLLQMLMLAVIALLCSIRLGINPARLFNRFLASMGLSEDDTLVTAFNNRSTQISALWSHYKQSPLFGHGAGATIDGTVRNQQYPWRFEMQYHLLLFEGGAVALALVLGAGRTALATIRRGARDLDKLESAILAASCISAVAMTISNGTNPYLRQVGLQFWLFIPFMILRAKFVANQYKSKPMKPASDTNAYAVNASSRR